MADLGFHEGGFISVEKNPRLRDKIWVGPGDGANSQYGQRSIARAILVSQARPTSLAEVGLACETSAIYGNDHPCLA